MANKKRNINLGYIVIAIIIIITSIIFLINKINSSNTEENNNEILSQKDDREYPDYVVVLDDDTKLNKNSVLNEDKRLDDLIIKDIKFTYQNGVTNLLATVENTSEKKVETTEIEIELIKEDGSVKYTLQGIIGEIEPKGTTILNSSITANFVDVYNINFKKK